MFPDRGQERRIRTDIKDPRSHMTARLGATKCGDMTEAVFCEPSPPFFGNDRGRNGIDAPGESLSGDQNVRDDAESGNTPDVSRAPKTGLDFIGDIERSVFAAQLPDSFKLSIFWQGKAAGGGDGFHNHGGRLFP